MANNKPTFEEEMLVWCAVNHYNLDPMYNGPLCVGYEYTVRLRPWKQATKAGVMALGSGSTLLDAMAMATRKAVSDKFDVLDWSARDARPNAARRLDTLDGDEVPSWVTTLGQEGSKGAK